MNYKLSFLHNSTTKLYLLHVLDKITSSASHAVPLIQLNIENTHSIISNTLQYILIDTFLYLKFYPNIIDPEFTRIQEIFIYTHHYESLTDISCRLVHN